MRKVFKIILAIFVVLIILVAAFAAVFFLDLSASMATGSETLLPSGTSVGNALVVYDPGLSGAAKNVASEAASSLQAAGYTVNLAGVKSSAAVNTAGYKVIVAGDPSTQAHSPAPLKTSSATCNLAKEPKSACLEAVQGQQPQKTYQP
jgi:hypothetical protein